MQALGRHILVEFIGCLPEIMNDVSAIEKFMVESAQEAGATVINSTFHHFSPYGVSGVVVIQESHLAIHTWPEYGYAAVDLFTCGDTVDPWISFDRLRQAFGAKTHSALEMYRGSLPLLDRSHLTERAQSQMEVKEVVPQFKRTLWFTDKDENQALSLRYSGDVLHHEKSPYQTVRVFESAAYGKMLTLNNAIMVTDRDEFHYHEMLVHPALHLVKEPKRVLVIGGGDGGTIREVFRYPSIEKVTMVEIDEAVIHASKKFFPNLAKEFSNPNLELRVEDGIEFIKNYQGPAFDAILIDGADPVGPAEGLFSRDFFISCHKHLSRQGILAAQGESPMFHQKAFRDLHRTLNDIFGSHSAQVLLFFATTYPSGMWSIHLASPSQIHPLADFDEMRAKTFCEKQNLRYYNPGVHKGSFELPTFVKKLLKD